MDRAELARSWATALNKVAYVARSRDAIEHDLACLAARLAPCLRHGADLVAAVEVGGELVGCGYVHAGCVRATIEVLGLGLSDVEGVGSENVVPVLAAVAAGFTAASRDRVFAEQEDMQRTLVRAKEVVERDLQASEGRFTDVFTTSAIGMVISDLGGGVVKANEALETMLGYRPGTLFRKRMTDLFHPDEAAFLRSRYAGLTEGGAETVRERTEFVRVDGDTVWVRVLVTLLRDGDGVADHHVTMVEDISDLHLLEGQLHYQTTHDVLTRTPNRSGFLGRLEESLGSTDATVFHIGLDGLGAVNNGFGRPVGDEILRLAARRIAEVFTGHDSVIARIGGDEFAVMVRQNEPDVDALCAELNELLAEPTYVDDHGIAVTATIAVHRKPWQQTDPADVLRATELAMSRLKAHGGRQWGLVDTDLDAQGRARDRRAASIPGGWENGELDVHYQPVVSLADGERVAVQAVLRWDSPTHGLIDHDACRTVLRDTGFSVPVDQWMIGLAAENVAKLGDDARLYVELSSAQAADQDLIGTVRGAVTRAQDRIDVGLPVGALSDPQAQENLGVLLELGYRVILTDFGRTAGDIVAVEDFAVHGVRISREVVDRIGADPAPESLFTAAVRVLVPMVGGIGRTILVPGIETARQAAWWLNVGADLASGPHFGSPGPIGIL